MAVDQGIALHHWNRSDLAKLVTKFAHLTDVDESTVKKINLEAATIKIGCDNEQSISKEFHAVIGNQLCKIKVKIQCRMIMRETRYQRPPSPAPTTSVDGRCGDCKRKGPAEQDLRP